MEDSDDDTSLQVLAESVGWEDPTSGEREAFENFSNKRNRNVMSSHTVGDVGFM